MTRRRRDVESIPVGTWEDKYFKCPPASSKSVKQISVDIDHKNGLVTKHNKARREQRLKEKQ